MKTCPKCGSTSPDSARFCANCGAPLNTGKPGRILPILAAAAVVLAVLAAVVFLLPQRQGKSASRTPDAPAQASEDAARIQWETLPGEASVQETVPASEATPAPSEDTAFSPEEKRPIAVDGGNQHSVILYSDGTVVTLGDDTYGQRGTSGWRNIVQISTFTNHTLGLRSDGTVAAAGDNSKGQCNVDQWTDIVAVAAGSRHSVGVRADGTVVAVGANEAGQCDVQDWHGVKAVAANTSSTFGLTEDGRVLVCGSFYDRNMNNWSGIVSLSVSSNHVVGMRSDGTVAAVGSNSDGQCDNLEKWSDTQAVAAGYGFTAGLRATGKVWVHGCDDHNEQAAMGWSDIVAIGSGIEHIIGIKADGTLVAKGTNDCGQCDMYRLNPQVSEN
ncbi:MAG: zinc-ribbon domain-containing protein [Faecousia sp.]